MEGTAPGWHGKLPSLGDFASRRLPHEFVEVWDHWLAEGLSTLRQPAPDAWLDGYLASPIWRFVLMPGALPGSQGTQGWTGVLMPSGDTPPVMTMRTLASGRGFLTSLPYASS